MKKGVRDLGKGLDQSKVEDVVEHWKIEGYDVYPFASWEGTHTSRGANIERDGTHIIQVGSLSLARQWIRQQIRPRCAACGATANLRVTDLPSSPGTYLCADAVGCSERSEGEQA
jgi:hypothetical protein